MFSKHTCLLHHIVSHIWEQKFPLLRCLSSIFVIFFIPSIHMSLLNLTFLIIFGNIHQQKWVNKKKKNHTPKRFWSFWFGHFAIKVPLSTSTHLLSPSFLQLNETVVMLRVFSDLWHINPFGLYHVTHTYIHTHTYIDDYFSKNENPKRLKYSFLFLRIRTNIWQNWLMKNRFKYSSCVKHYLSLINNKQPYI